MKTRYHYEIDINDLMPPIGDEFRYTATATIYEDLGDSERVVHIIKELWGQTKQIAEDKAAKRAKDWIEKQTKT